MRYPLLVFDWDGTLSDSTAKVVRAMTRAITELGYPAKPPNSIMHTIGLGLDEAIEVLYSALSKVERDALKAAFIVNHRGDDCEPDFYPDVLATLYDLKASGYTLCVATGKSRVGLDRLLSYHAVTELFSASRCADETRSKPAPQMLTELLSHTGFEASEAIMVGDTSFDMIMAQCIGMPRIAVSFGAHAVDQLECYDPLLVIDNFQSMHHWLSHEGA
ncbi:HAD-IA family hydrolase [bacterium]|nr:HAD-IA family hydrolase [bacterium]